MRRLLLFPAALLLACPTTPADDDDSAVSVDDDDAVEPTPCEILELPARPWEEGETGVHRHTLAGDFTVELVDGSTWNLQENWTGCDAIVFIPDSLTYSDIDGTSLWEQGVLELIAGSPRNARYFFISLRNDVELPAWTEAQQARIDADLATLPAEDAAWWADRLHVLADDEDNVGGWVEDILSSGFFGGGIGRQGFGIDRHQRIRTVGRFSDVTRYDPAIQQANPDAWPWAANLAYAAHEARWYNAIAVRQARLDAEDVTTVRVHDNEVHGHFDEREFTLPDAATMGEFDHLEIDLTMDCAEPEDPEFGNCGPWDYLSHLYLQEPRENDKDPIVRWELARFVTTYHREGRYVVDATGVLPLLRDGGTKLLYFDISPPWNPQAYAMTLDLRFSDRGKGAKPTAAHYLWGTRGFNSTYNDDRLPVDVDVPATVTRAEVWATISGHGMDTNNCAEFCDHRHVFTVGADSYTREHPEVGDNQGCIGQIENGMTPNQGGTWWLGRGGWCPGQQVDPDVFDVTAQITPGAVNTVSYAASYRGATIPDSSGNIVLSSWLVLWE